MIEKMLTYQTTTITQQISVFFVGREVNTRIQPSTLKQNNSNDRLNDLSLSVLLKIRNETGIRSIAEMAKSEHRDAVKKAVSSLHVNDFSIQQWRIAAFYLVGKRIDIISSEQAVCLILQ